MATRKKAKGKKAKKKAVGKGARKKVKVTRRAAKKKIVAKKPAKAKAKKGGAAKKIATGPAVVAPPAGDRIGIVTHYFTHLSVAILRLDSGSLREGDTVHIKGHTSDFQQRVESMELDHAHVSEAHAGQSVGLRVTEHAREHDVVYKV